MIIAPTWYDPCRDQLCAFEEAVDQLEAETRAFREDRHGHVATGMRLWKRSRLQQVFGRTKPLIFENDPARAAQRAAKTGRTLLIWANRATPETQGLRVEDGFLRSRGLGADLVPPLSLVTDDLGIYYDPTRPSRLEHLIQSPLPAAALHRANDLIQRLITLGVSKYNLPGTLPDLPDTLPDLPGTLPDLPGTLPDLPGTLPDLPGTLPDLPDTLPDLPPGPRIPSLRILVPGQVEDDASIRLGSPTTATNLALLCAARAANPTATLIYKPHPDVEAGLRPGALSAVDLAQLTPPPIVAYRADPLALIAACDAVWTMTSLLGFEALLRGKPVTTLGAPFYAGWGLTTDAGPIPDRRKYAPDGHPLPRPTLAHLAHAALIAYPRYYDPVTRRPCPPEVAVDRLASGQIPRPGLPLRLLAKLQGTFASYATLWR